MKSAIRSQVQSAGQSESVQQESEVGNEALHTTWTVVSVNVAALAVVPLVFVAFTKGVAVCVEIAEFTHCAVQLHTPAAVRDAGSVLEVALLSCEAV